MGMYDEKVVLCGANSYEEKYYLNPDFEQLPDDVKNELKIMCVLYVHDVGCNPDAGIRRERGIML